MTTYRLTIDIAWNGDDEPDVDGLNSAVSNLEYDGWEIVNADSKEVAEASD